MTTTPAPERPERKHEVKVWPAYFDSLLNGNKTSELRLNDREYGVGDTVLLREFDPRPGHVCGDYTGRKQTRKITHILHDMAGLLPGYCVLSLAQPEQAAPVRAEFRKHWKYAHAEICGVTGCKSDGGPYHCSWPMPEILKESEECGAI